MSRRGRAPVWCPISIQWASFSSFKHNTKYSGSSGAVIDCLADPKLSVRTWCLQSRSVEPMDITPIWPAISSYEDRTTVALLSLKYDTSKKLDQFFLNHAM
jgi:hypothetical protein